MSAGGHVVMSAGHVKVRRVGLMLRVVIEGVDGERITVEIGRGDLTLLDDNTATVDTWRLAPGFEPVEGAEPVLRVPRSIDVAALADARVVDGGQS